jgi:alkylation response protein AidB-like acyl-CoA dehydrogenase
MGLRGSSTAALYLDRVKVPVSNVLGQTGRGHIVAFNVLNFGRLKMGASTLGAARDVLAQSIAYARERRAFGRSIAEFGAIREKLAAMTLRIFAAESILWRTAGMIEQKSRGISSEEPGAPEGKLQAIEEYAVECSIVKVFGSEMLDFVVDEGVQIHGGYGYHEDYRVERAYRDARINRIFEGTNEINRLLIPRMLLERARKGRLALLEWIEDPEDGSGTDDPVAKAKRILRLTFGLALRRYPEDLEEHQEILMRLADIVIGIYAMESVALRVRKHRVAPEREDIWQVFAQEAMTGIERAAREVIGASAPDSLRSSATRDLDAMAALPTSDMIGLRERIAARALELE